MSGDLTGAHQAAPPADVLDAFALSRAQVTSRDEGHIHHTFVAALDGERWVLQHVNAAALGPARPLMDNALLTVACIAGAGGQTLDYRRTVGDDVLVDAEDGAWRCYRFVEGRVVARPGDAATAEAIGHGFGSFDAALASHPADGWHAVLAGYHDHAKRMKAFRAAVDADACDRLRACGSDVADIERLAARLEEQAGFAAWHEAPVRVAHHDAKGVNLVFGTDAVTVLDLDTVMAGTVLSDIGELVRTCTRPHVMGAPFDVDLGAAAVRGFVAGWAGAAALTDAERAAAPIAGLMMTTQNAMRFLTDHLMGDVYFHAEEPDSNLVRARVMAAHADAQWRVHREFVRALDSLGD